MIVILLADGFEEIEAIGTADILRRANLCVTLISINDTKMVTSARNVNIIADDLVENLNFENIEAIILPGGMIGVENLGRRKAVSRLIANIYGQDKLIAAICAAPTLLSSLGIIKNKVATCYPGLELKCLEYKEDSVVVDGNVITSRGAGTTHLFAAAIIEYFLSKQEADEILLKMIY